MDQPLKLIVSNEASRDPAAFARNVRQAMEYEAVAFWTAEEFRRAAGDVELSQLVKVALAAPADPQDPRRTRYRYFGGGIFFPFASREWTIVPSHRDTRTGEVFTRYFQPVEVNADAGGVMRRFAPLPQDVWESQALRRVVDLLFDATPHALVSRKMPVAFHVHMITLRSDGVVAGISLPNYLHRDLEPVTYVILLDRTPNAGGAISHIAPATVASTNVQDLADDYLIAERTLLEPFEGFGFWDERVSHDVTPLYSTDGCPATRAAMLVDFGNVAV